MTDTERIDKLQSLLTGYGYGEGVICRMSSTNRGLRLHESSRPDSVKDIRTAIDNFLKKEE